MEKKILTKVISAIILYSAALNAYAVAEGLYFGGQVGSAHISGSSNIQRVNHAFVLSNPSGNQLAGRIFAGYQANPYVGLELGLAGLTSFDLQVQRNFVFNNNNGNNIIINNNGSVVANQVEIVDFQKTSAFFGWFDFGVRLSYSICPLTVYAKAAAALTYVSFDVNVPQENVVINGNNNNNNNGNNSNTNNIVIINDNGNGFDNNDVINQNGTVITPQTETESQTKFAPLFTVGVSYDLNDYWSIDASASRLYINNSFINKVNFYALGITYRLVQNRYCGQFLCDD